METAADAPDRGAPGRLETQLSDCSETLSKHRHGVKDYFPNYVLEKARSMCHTQPGWAGTTEGGEELTISLAALRIVLSDWLSRLFSQFGAD